MGTIITATGQFIENATIEDYLDHVRETPPEWDESKYKDKRGYIRYVHGDKLLHRVRMEKRLGRKLHFNGLDDPKSEVVHHIDYDKLNNCPSNLCIMANSEHARLHKKDNND